MVDRWVDTSALLRQNNFVRPIAISPLTLSELEHIKSSEKTSEKLKYNAREVIRAIISSQNIDVIPTDNHHIDKMIKKYKFLSNINDHRIICEAELAAERQNKDIIFTTCDALQYKFACEMPHLSAEYLPVVDDTEEEWAGWSRFYPTEQEMAMLYSDPKINILKAKVNEFCEIYEGQNLKDVLVWTGNEYRSLKYKEFTAPTGERIAPRNIEQKMYFDLLQNDNIPIKLCIGRFGTGKSMIAETWATHQLSLGKYNKIVFVKNNLEVKGAGRLGILPGDEIEKQYPWLRQVEDHLGPQLFDEYLDDGRIEPAHLSTLRGRDLKNCLILVDEAENLLTTNIQLLLGRVGEGSQIIFCGDIKQCDYKDEKASGIPKLISKLAGDPLFGMVRLIKSERSLVAGKADLLD